MKKTLIFCITIILIIGCSKKKEDPIIEFTKRFDKEDFTCLQDLFIANRGTFGGKISLIISKFDSKCPPYTVLIHNNKIEIKNNLLTNKCEDYLEFDQIEASVKCFLKYDLKVIGVDKNLNVFINPSEESQPSLLRKSNSDTIINLKKYKNLRANWYIKK